MGVPACGMREPRWTDASGEWFPEGSILARAGAYEKRAKAQFAHEYKPLQVYPRG
jgi:hypothetical protein